MWETVPTSLTGEEAALFGTILQHAYSQFSIFPYQLSKAVYEFLFFGRVRDEVLLDSFLHYVQESEGKVIKKLLAGELMDDESREMVLDILMDSGVNGIPNASNVNRLILQAAKNVFVQKPFYVLSQIRSAININVYGLGTVGEFDEFWDLRKPTVSNLLTYFTFEGMLSPLEERISTYFTRYLRGSEENTRCLLVQFCTGSINIDLEKVSVRFVNQEKTLRILSKACFKLLYLPRQLESFRQFKSLLDTTLNNSAYWTMND